MFAQVGEIHYALLQGSLSEMLIFCWNAADIECATSGSSYHFAFDNGLKCCKYYYRKSTEGFDGTDLRLTDPEAACYNNEWEDCPNAALGGKCIDHVDAPCKCLISGYS